MSPDDIKRFVLEVAGWVCEDARQLEQLGVDTLAPFVERIGKISLEPGGMELLSACVDIHRDAYIANPAATLEAYAFWDDATVDAISRLWSLVHLQRPKAELEIEEFVSDILTVIGTLVEGVLQPFMRHMLHLSRIRRKKAAVGDEIAGRKLGVILDELLHEAALAPLLRPGPQGKSITQWRNVAQHASYVVRGGNIHCMFGEGSNKEEVVVTRDQLLQVARAVHLAAHVIMTAHRAFLIDHLRELREILPTQVDREDDRAFQFTSAVATQGFKVVDFSLNTEAATCVLIDQMHAPDADRQWHASQMAFVLWTYFARPMSTVEYRELSGRPVLRTSSPGELCEALQSGRISKKEYIYGVTFTRLPGGE